MSTPPADRPVVVFAAQRVEIEPLRRRIVDAGPVEIAGLDARRGRQGATEIVTVVTGEGRRAARRAAARVFDAIPCGAALVVGVAGALSEDLPVGTVIAAETVADEDGNRHSLPALAGEVAATVLTVDRIVARPEERRRLLEGLDVAPAVVDMESFDIVDEAVSRGLPIRVLRAVSDGPDDVLPSWLDECRDREGRVSRPLVTRRLATRPWALPGLLRLGRRVAALSETLAERALDSFVDRGSEAAGDPSGI
jgi:adenosylhomocysteine nucleosidase